jgi:hypothetical protein
MIVVRALLVLLICSSWCLAEEKPARLPTLEEVRKVPVGLKVTHAPTEASAVTGAETGFNYTWFFRTTVTAIDADVSILYFSFFVKRDDEWVHGKVFTPEEFAEWYACPDGLVRKGESFSDAQNWSAGDDLSAGQVIWYFVGKRKDGTVVHGEAEVTLLAKLKE